MDYGGIVLSNREFPHKAMITFNIDIRSVNIDGSLSPSSLSDKKLLRYGIGQRAEMVIEGLSEADCIKNVKARLEKLNE